MARILGYIAASLDGFIADRNEALGWLSKYDAVELGEHSYANFIAHIRTIVMGRATYDWLVANSADWPYAAQRTIVVTSRPIAALPAGVETRSDIEALVAELRGLEDGDVWMCGGGRLQMAFIEHGALDEIEIYLVAELIGGGHPLFPPTGFRASPELVSAKMVGPGMARLHYRFG